MINTYEPQLIYDMFDHYGFNVLRIDQFDSGTFAKIRAELSYEQLSANQLLEIATRLISLEKNENLEVQVVMVDMRHRSLTVNILVRDQEATIIG
jgi:23S rRNA U2552 (ribose-2'-O)-methylase RlmE/FtsJ